MTGSPIHACQADYRQPEHAAALVSLLDAYARDPMGGGVGLSDFAKRNPENPRAELGLA